MIRRTTPILLIFAMALAFGASPATAQKPTVAQRIVIEFFKTGKINVCEYSPQQLKKLKTEIPVDLNQYSAGFIAAIDDALAARAQGKCNKDSEPAAPPVADQAAPPAATEQAPPPSTDATPQASAPSADASAPAQAQAQAQAPPAPAGEPNPAESIAADDSIALASNSTEIATEPPVPVLLLAILAALLALSATAFGFARWFAWQPAWVERVRHSTGEASRRASSTFAEFADYVRLGR